MITKIADIEGLLLDARRDPSAAFVRLRELAVSDEWAEREVAATGMVDIGKRHPARVLDVAAEWAGDKNPFVRRAASEGLRGIVKHDPEGVRPILERLRADPDRYVQKSVANVLRNATGRHPEFVLAVCDEWARSATPETRWIIRDGLRKMRTQRPDDVARVLASIDAPTSKG